MGSAAKCPFRQIGGQIKKLKPYKTEIKLRL